MNRILGEENPIYEKIDYVIGIISAGAIIVVWVPQIYITFKLKGPKSLSVITLLLTAPGSALSIYFMISFHQTILVWLPAAFSCFFQLILLFMCLYYLYGNRCCPSTDYRLIVNQSIDESSRENLRITNL